MENQITIINPKEFGLEENKALELTVGLNLILNERETLKNAFIDVIDLEITAENLPIFKELRTKFLKNRTLGIVNWHKVNKEVSLRIGQFYDAVKNKEISENEYYENALLEKEKYFENLEKERLKAVHLERVSQLTPFNYEIGNIDFSGMDINMFNAILLGAETAHKNKLEAEKQAELARLEVIRLEDEQKEKQRLELIELKKQNEIKEKELEIQKAKADAELAEVNRLAKIESDKQQAILLEQQKANAKLQAELKAKADAEKLTAEKLASELKAKELADKKALKAPDKDKMAEWINNLELLSIDLKSKDSKTTATEILTKFAGFKKWANEQINNL